MNNLTLEIQNKLKNWMGGSEADVKRILVEPVLEGLGYNIMSIMEVRGEYGGDPPAQEVGQITLYLLMER